jgi:hypothetical protein
MALGSLLLNFFSKGTLGTFDLKLKKKLASFFLFNLKNMKQKLKNNKTKQKSFKKNIEIGG